MYSKNISWSFENKITGRKSGYQVTGRIMHVSIKMHMKTLARCQHRSFHITACHVTWHGTLHGVTAVQGR